MGDQNQWEKEVVIMQDSPSFRSRAKSPMRKKLWYSSSLFQKDDIYCVCTHTHTHPPAQLKDLAFSLFKNRITVLLI